MVLQRAIVKANKFLTFIKCDLYAWVVSKEELNLMAQLDKMFKEAKQKKNPL